MARIWQTGFETGSRDIFDLSTGSNATGVQTTTVRNGTYALEGGSTGPLFAITAISECYFRFGFYLKSPETSIDLLMRFIDPDGTTVQGELDVNAQNLRVLRSNSVVLETSGTALGQDTWHLIEGRYLCANSGGRWTIKQNGTQVIDFTGDTQQAAGATFDRIRVMGGSGAGSGYMDDFVLNDITGSTNNTFPGEGKILAMKPTAAGDVTQLQGTGTGTGNWDRVEEVGPDDTNYNFETVAGEYDLYNLGTISNISTVNAIVTWVRAQKNDSGTGAMKIVTKDNAVEYRTASTNLTTSWAYYKDIREARPGGGSWTQAALDALQVGFEAQ